MEEINAITTKLFHAKHRPFRKNSKQRVLQQFARLNITFTEDDIQRWMSCDGPGCEHMDEQEIVALITGDNEKEADEAVEDETGVSQPSNSPFSHAEAMQKIDLAYYRCQPEAKPEDVSKLIQFREFSAKKRESSSNKLPFFLFSKRNFKLIVSVFFLVNFKLYKSFV